ncbi:hypothetical protein MBLNU230_g6662t1 [Neophaeotheca triangularis]
MSRPAPVTRRSTRSEYIETDTGNKISRRARIEGKTNIMLGGKTVLMENVHLRGDLNRPSSSTPSDASSKPATPSTAITIGRYTLIAPSTTLTPPIRFSRGVSTPYPMRIGDNVFVGPNCSVGSISISSHVWVGEGCALGAFSVVKEFCKILPGTVLPGGMVVPPGSVVGGRPGRVVGEVGEGWGVGMGGVVGSGSGDGEVVEGGELRGLVKSIK